MARMGNKKTYKKKTYRNKSNTKAMYKIANKVLMSNAEVKKRRNAVQEVTLNINSGGSVFYQEINTNILQGSTYAQMEGHLVKGRNYTIRGLIHNNHTVGICVRLSVLNVKRGSNIDYQTGSNLFETDTQDDSGLGTIIDCYKRYNLDEYKVLYDKVYKIAPSSSVDGNNFKDFRLNFKCPFKYRFDGTNTYPEVNKLVVVMHARTPNNDVEVGICEITCETNFYYTDI